MSKEFRVPATQLYQDSLLIGEEAAEAIAFGSKDPQPVTITDIAGQQRLGELHKKFKVPSGVAAIFKASIPGQHDSDPSRKGEE